MAISSAHPASSDMLNMAQHASAERLTSASRDPTHACNLGMILPDRLTAVAAISESATSISMCSAALLASFCLADISFCRMSGRSSTVVSALTTYDLALSMMDCEHPMVLSPRGLGEKPLGGDLHRARHGASWTRADGPESDKTRAPTSGSAPRAPAVNPECPRVDEWV